MTVFNAGPRAQTIDFRAGDVGLVKRANGHSVLNTGTTDLVFLAVFMAAQYEEITLSDWLTHLPRSLVAQHLNVGEQILAKLPSNDPGIVPG